MFLSFDFLQLFILQIINQTTKKNTYKYLTSTLLTNGGDLWEKRRIVLEIMYTTLKLTLNRTTMNCLLILKDMAHQGWQTKHEENGNNPPSKIILLLSPWHLKGDLFWSFPVFLFPKVFGKLVGKHFTTSNLILLQM